MQYFKSKLSKLIGLVSVAAFTIACLSPTSSGPSVDLNQPVKVAILAPSAAADAGLQQIGASLINSAKLAVQDLNASNDIELIVLPTNFSAENAVSQAMKAKEAGAALIIGPLSGFNAAGVATAVGNVPVWTFSNNGEVVSPNTYILGTSFNVIADRVVGYVKSTGVKSMGIIATDDASGEVGLVASLEAANNNRMRVVYTAKYPLAVDAINAAAPSIAASLKSTGAEALMFTDSPAGGLGVMANALSAQGYTSADSTFMGLSRWDAFSGFLAQTNLSGGYFAVPDLQASAAFDRKYAATYGSAPHPLGGLGYDGVAAAVTFIRDAKKSGDRTPFDARDVRGVNVRGALGAFKFNGSNHAERALSVMQVRNSSSVVVSPAPSSF